MLTNVWSKFEPDLEGSDVGHLPVEVGLRDNDLDFKQMYAYT